MTLTFKAREANGEIIHSALHAFTFPAGEKHIKKTEGRDLQPVEIAVFQPDPTSMHDDLFDLAMWADYIANEQVDNTRLKSVLIMPYMPAARADRGNPFGLSVYADFINSMFIDQIIIFDPHSQVTPEFLDPFDNLTVVYSAELFDQKHMRAVLNGYTGIIAPDKGAALRAQAVADLAELPVFTATKHRDEESGQLSGFAIEGLDENGTYLIIDDICDGGGTFLGLAEAAGLDFGQIDLYVSHGVFSKEALTNLAKTFAYIFTTNSYNPMRPLVIGDPQKFDADATTPYRRFDVIRLLLSKIKY